MSDLFEGRVFNTVEEINKRFGVEVELPDNIPEGCNLLCYKIAGLSSSRLVAKYMENTLGLHTPSPSGKWYVINEDLEKEIEDDLTCLSDHYIYLRLNKEETKKEVFKPERLLGVETTKGFINDLDNRDALLINKTWYHPTALRYYISDDSNETVSFQEYVDMFYIRG